MKIMNLFAITALSLSSFQGFADAPVDNGETIEVTGTDLSGGISSLSSTAIVGMVGSVSGAATAAVKQAALKAAAKAVAEKKLKQQEQKDKDKQENNDFKKAVDGEQGIGAAIIHEGGLLFRQLTANGSEYSVQIKDADGSEVHIKDCQPSGPLNPNKHTCTQQKIERFTDPSDGVEKYVWSFGVVQGQYNPKNYDADADGYYAVVVDKQFVALVIDNMDDLAWQFARVFPVK